MLALACLLLSQNVPDPDWVQGLGRERAAYGDIPNSGEWKFVLSGNFGGTTILYRAGSSTERYYLSYTSGSGKRRLSRTTLVKGTIRRDWMIHMKDGGRSRIARPGTLWTFAIAGNEIVGKVPEAAMKDLQNSEPLVGYTFNIHAPYCFVVFESGKDVGTEPWDVTSNDNLPKTVSPYPIPKVEADYVGRKRHR